MKNAYLDFEFNQTMEPYVNLVSLSLVCTKDKIESYRRDFWLYKDSEGPKARDFLRLLKKEGYTFIGYAFEAEARSLSSLFKGQEDFLKGLKVIDLYLEYRCLLNHNHLFAYGKQLLNGLIKTTKPPKSKWEAKDLDEENNKPSYSLASATYKLLGERIDTVEKEQMREVILRNDPAELAQRMRDIQRYNASDIKYLPRLLSTFYRYYLGKHFSGEEYLLAAYSRGEYAVRTAHMVNLGYPINRDKVDRFISNVDKVIESSILDCLESTNEFKPFRKVKNKWVCDQKAVRSWALLQKKPYWRKTKQGQLSLSRDAFKDWYSSESEGFPGAYCRYSKTKQSLNGFMPGGKRGKFTDFIGADSRVRPFFGIYGAQSSRSQPGATGFIPLKAHWMRNFIEARRGRAIVGLDYASQEFLIAAILSQDRRMMRDYESGDVYLAYGKARGLIPQEGTKATHSLAREFCKVLILGMSYDMSGKGMAHRLSAISGKEITERQADKYIGDFYDYYGNFSDYKWEVLTDYQDLSHLTLSDGWVMWGDNSNQRSVGNFPIQGHGAVIMRRSVAMAQDSGLDILYTLHDALYAEFDSQDTEKIILLRDCMQKAFGEVMSKYGKTIPIRIEGEAWSKDYETQPLVDIADVKFMPEYIDSKGKADYERYRSFFTAKVH